MRVPPEEKSSSPVGLLFTLGGSLAAWMTGGVLAGRWMDGHFASGPWGLVLGASLGATGAGITFFQVVRKL